MMHEESKLQQACVRCFRYMHPKIALLLFAVPNGGSRNVREAAIMKAEGVTAGVADLILLVPRGSYSSLCMEFKTKTGRQSPAQKTWQQAAESAKNKYVIIRSVDDFEREVGAYLRQGSYWIPWEE